MSINLGHIVATVDGDHLTGEPVAARAAAALILAPAQAEAVYSAMCALNNVGGLTDTIFGSSEDGVRVYESKHGRGFVWVTRMRRNAVVETEKHSDQTAFATAYGLTEAPADSVRKLLAEAVGLMPLGTAQRADWVTRAAAYGLSTGA